MLLLIITFSVFNLEDTSSKGMITMLSLILLIIPLVSIIFSTIYIYNSTEFIELILSQPINRKSIWLSLYFGLSISLGISFLIGSGLIIILFSPDAKGIMLLSIGVSLSFIFSSIAMLVSVLTRDKAKGMGIAILLWLYFSVIFDGVLLFASFQFSDYPIEKGMVLLSMLNPIDLSRVLMLMQYDISALMGYSGAIFKNYFGTDWGMVLSVTSIFLWVILPLYSSVRLFSKKDL
jgi:Cu-processing system permease protein